MELWNRRFINILIDCVIIVFSGASIFVSLTMLLILLYHLITNKHSPHRVVLLLAANMYLILFLFFILILDTYKLTLAGHIYINIPIQDNFECELRAYLVTVIICTLFYSNTLQAIYQLCRIVFHRHKRFRSFRLYLITILLQWIFCFLIIFPAFYFDNFRYILDDYHCEFAYTNLQGVFTYGIIIYAIPLLITVGCYFITLTNTYKRTDPFPRTGLQRRKSTIQRDVLVLFRISVLLILMISFFMPATIIFIMSMFTGYLPWWSSQVRWMSYVFSLTAETIVLTYLSPQVKTLWQSFI